MKRLGRLSRGGRKTIGTVTALEFHSYGANVYGGIVVTNEGDAVGIGTGEGAGLIASFTTPGDEFGPPPGPPTGVTIVDGGDGYPLGCLVSFYAIYPESDLNKVWFTVTGVG